MKFLKWTALTLIFILVILNAAILISGRTYLYKGIANTYLKGRKNPTIDDFRIFPHREIRNGNPRPWPHSSNYSRLKLLPKEQSEMKELETTALVIIKNDSLLFEQYWEYYSDSTISNSFSMAKTILSILTGIALKEGKIRSIDDPVHRYLPDFYGDGKEDITLRHLLTMSAGIDFEESYSSPFTYPAEAYYGTDLEKVTMKYNPFTRPGEYFDYQSGVSQLLAFALTNAVNTTLSNYASEKLWKPIGAEHPAQWSLDRKEGMEKAFCCFIATARDFARLGKLYMQDGRWDNSQIVTPEYVQASITPAPLKEKNNAGPNKRFGFAWWILPREGETDLFYARGVHGQYVICYPEENMIVVRLGRKRIVNTGVEAPKDMYLYMSVAERLVNQRKGS